MSGLFPTDTEDALYVSRHDPGDLLGTCSAHSILLDELLWPTVEHYFQGMQFTDSSLQERIRQADSAEAAARMGEPGWWDRLSGSHKRNQRTDWQDLKSVYMTRALYTKCRTYPDIAAHLLASGTRRIVENSQYDYYWGCGRDLRGQNMYGKVLMNIRDKLNELEKTLITS